MLVYKSGSFQDVEMSGDAAMDEDGLVTISDSVTVTGWTMGASAGTTPSVNDGDTSLATTLFVQNETVASGDVTGTLATGLTIGTGTVEASMIASDIDFATTGTITGGIAVVVESAAATDVLAATETVGKMFIASYATGPMDYTLPDVSIGLSACFYDEEGDGITIDTNASEIIILDGTALTGGYAIDSPGVAGGAGTDPGSFVCLLGISATQWITLGRSGTWIDGGAD
jgi:hypothetical protein